MRGFVLILFLISALALADDVSISETERVISQVLSHLGQKSVSELPRTNAIVAFWFPEGHQTVLAAAQVGKPNPTAAIESLRDMIENPRPIVGTPLTTSDIARLILSDAGDEAKRLYETLYGDVSQRRHKAWLIGGDQVELLKKSPTVQFTKTARESLLLAVQSLHDQGRYGEFLDVLDEAMNLEPENTSQALSPAMYLQSILAAEASGDVLRERKWEKRLREKLPGMSDIEEEIRKARSSGKKMRSVSDAPPVKREKTDQDLAPVPLACYDLPSVVANAELDVISPTQFVFRKDETMFLWNQRSLELEEVGSSSNSRIVDARWLVRLDPLKLSIRDLSEEKTLPSLSVKSTSPIQRAASLATVAMSDSGEWLAIVDNRKLRVFDLKTGAQIREFETPGFEGFEKILFVPGESKVLGLRSPESGSASLLVHDVKSGTAKAISPSKQAAPVVWDALGVISGALVWGRNPQSNQYFFLDLDSGETTVTNTFVAGNRFVLHPDSFTFFEKDDLFGEFYLRRMWDGSVVAHYDEKKPDEGGRYFTDTHAARILLSGDRKHFALVTTPFSNPTSSNSKLCVFPIPAEAYQPVSEVEELPAPPKTPSAHTN